MKIRLLLALVGFAISFVVPTIAQEQKAVDPEVRQQIEAAHMKFVEAFNKHDAAAIAALYALDAVRVLDGLGTLVGRDAIEKDFAVHFASSPPNAVGKSVQIYAMGDQIAGISDWSEGHERGYGLKVYVRDADNWKIRMEYYTLRNIP